MGNNIRTPKTKYFGHGSVSFYVKDKQVYYKVWLWLHDGTTHFLYKDAKFEGITLEQILDEVKSHSFTSVEVENWILNY